MKPPKNRIRSLMIGVLTRLAGAAVAQCREAARLTSAERERPLTTRQRISIRIHNRICPECAEFEKQLVVMSRCAKEDPVDQSLSDAEKKRLIEALEAEARSPSEPPRH